MLGVGLVSLEPDRTKKKETGDGDEAVEAEEEATEKTNEGGKKGANEGYEEGKMSGGGAQTSPKQRGGGLRSREMSVGYVLAFLNVLFDVAGSAITKHYGVGLTTWDINLVRFGSAAVILGIGVAFTRLVLHLTNTEFRVVEDVSTKTSTTEGTMDSTLSASPSTAAATAATASTAGAAGTTAGPGAGTALPVPPVELELTVKVLTATSNDEVDIDVDEESKPPLSTSSSTAAAALSSSTACPRDAAGPQLRWPVLYFPTLRRWSWVMVAAGVLLVTFLCPAMSQYVEGGSHYYWNRVVGASY